MFSRIRWLAIAAAIAPVACASSPPPTDTLARSHAAVRGAQVSGAEQNPSAALHLRLAQEQLDLGKKKMAEGENDRARYLFLRAEADADVALNVAREAQAKQEAAQTMQQLQAMQGGQGKGP